ncbi:MAG: SurA N-terminal domain-containing protein [Deltaproteobacteria bacterium]|nr:SurA N-terminal domain-containing protein [Deltaproteobacteria bacterium]
MLDLLRKRKRSWVIIFLLGIIVFVFVLWGVGSYMTQPRLVNAAKVNGEFISYRELETKYQRAIQTYRDLFKQSMTREAIESLNLRGGLLAELIHNRLLLQEARRLGLEVADEELMESIARFPVFQINGRFNRDLYLRILRSKRITPGRFETDQREELTIQRLYDIIRDSVHITAAEVQDRYRIENERINLYFIRLSAKDFIHKAKVTEADIKEHYERNKEALREPLQVQVEYLTYPFDHFSSRVQVSQKEIEELYNITRETRFHEPKAVRLKHFFSRAPAGKNFEKEREKARLKAEGVLREVLKGKEFTKLIEEHSDDFSEARRGDAGFFTRGQLLSPLEKIAFALENGEISNVVETSLGFHIIKVEEIREEKTKSLEEAKEEIIRTIKQDRGRDEAARTAEEDREKAFEGMTLSALAKERQLSLKVSRFFTRNEVLQEIGGIEAFYKSAFALSPKQVSPVTEGAKAVYLIKLRERKEPRIPPLATIHSDLEKKLNEKKAMELATQRATSLLGQLRGEKDIEQFARQHSLKLEETGLFRRRDVEIPKVGTLQELQLNGIPLSPQRLIPDQIYTQRDAVYIFAFKESQGADMETFEKEKSLLEQTVLSAKRRRALQRFVEILKVSARIEVQPEALEGS